MSYALIYRVDLGSAQSPFRVVAQPTGREVGWINRFLDQCCVRGLAWHTLRGYAFDLTHFIRWWAERHVTDEVTEQALTTSSLLDYMRYQAEQQLVPPLPPSTPACGWPNAPCVASSPTLCHPRRRVFSSSTGDSRHSAMAVRVRPWRACA
jgi:hypothetical protein